MVQAEAVDLRAELDARNAEVLGRAGLTMVYGYMALGGDGETPADTEFMTRCEELAGRGLQILIGPGIPSRSSRRSVGLWMPADRQTLHPNLRLDNGRYTLPDLLELPEVLYDGHDSAYRTALRPHAETFLAELADAEAVRDITEYSKPRFTKDTDPYEHGTRLAAWRAEHPDPTVLLEVAQQQKLDIRYTNNLYLLFVTDSAGNPQFDTDLSRAWIAKVEAEYPDFVSACRLVARGRVEADSMAVEAFHNRQPQSKEQEVGRTVDTWVCDRYMTRMMYRLRSLGASKDVVKRLMN